MTPDLTFRCEICKNFTSHDAQESIAHFLAVHAMEKLKSADEQIARLKRLVSRQADDAGIWFDAQTAPEAYLQQELRSLHKAVEDIQVL